MKRSLRRYVCVVGGMLAIIAGAGRGETQFFAVEAPHDAVITGWRSDGTLVWSNAAIGVTARVFRAATLLGDAEWMEHMEVFVSDEVMERQAVVLSRTELDAESRSAMLLIPGGTFLMGDTMGDTWAPSDELPVHGVTVTSFYMSRVPVTKGEWDSVFSWAVTNGYSFLYDGADTEAMKPPDHPVGDVTWYDAVKWCNAKSEKEGLTPCYTVGGNVFRSGTNDPDCDWAADGYRLPTEAEWEYAARGGLAGRRFPWGNRISHLHANYEASCDGDDFIFPYDDGPTCGHHPGYPLFFLGSPVNAFPPNGFGLYDMAGNHWHWCWDWYDEGYYAYSPATNPRGPVAGTKRTLRGGEMSNFGPTGCRVSNRLSTAPGSRTFAEGFRVVRSSL